MGLAGATGFRPRGVLLLAVLGTVVAGGSSSVLDRPMCSANAERGSKSTAIPPSCPPPSPPTPPTRPSLLRYSAMATCGLTAVPQHP